METMPLSKAVTDKLTQMKSHSQSNVLDSFLENKQILNELTSNVDTMKSRMTCIEVSFLSPSSLCLPSSASLALHYSFL